MIKKNNIDSINEDSFPASDPPSWPVVTGVGRPDNESPQIEHAAPSVDKGPGKEQGDSLSLDSVMKELSRIFVVMLNEPAFGTIEKQLRSFKQAHFELQGKLNKQKNLKKIYIRFVDTKPLLDDLKDSSFRAHQVLTDLEDIYRILGEKDVLGARKEDALEIAAGILHCKKSLSWQVSRGFDDGIN